MVKHALFILLVITFISCHNPKPQPKAMVVVHGGACYVSTDLMLPGEEEGDHERTERASRGSRRTYKHQKSDRRCDCCHGAFSPCISDW